MNASLVTEIQPNNTMQIDIAAHIEKLLFLHDTLSIPGFGGFTASRAAAAVDYAGGAVTPPSKTLSFSENLAVDDGILVDELVKTYHIPTDEARDAIRQFVEQMQAQLDQREIVTLPGIGRLYKNYVQKIQFLPDATNFHAGSYGLPPLQFSPIARSREVSEKPASATEQSAGKTAETTPPTQGKTTATPSVPPLPPPPNFVSEPYTAPRSSAAQFGTGIGIGLIIITATFGIWWWINKKNQDQERQATELLQESDTTPTKVSPMPGISDLAKLAEKDKPATAPAKPEPEDQDLNDEVEEAAAKKVEMMRRQNEAPPSAKPTPKTEGRQCILVIATLQDSNNADRLIAKLQGAGYEVYHLQQRGHQIGIQFNYTNPAEIDARKAELIRFTGEKGIFVKKK